MSYSLNVDNYLTKKKNLMLANYCPISYDSNTDTYKIDESKLEDVNDDDNYYNISSKYYKTVKKGNTYINDLLNTEEKYFKEKYGSKIYEYLLDKRNKYIKNKINPSKPISTSTDNIDIKKFYKREIKEIESMYKLYEDTIVIDKSKDLYRRKIYYRTTELININYVNAISNIIYYFLFVCILILLFSRNQLNLDNKGKMYLYIFVFIFPLIYHYLFDILAYLYRRIHDLFIRKIPKHAFKNNLKFYDDELYEKDKE